jgi:hypothetical protein
MICIRYIVGVICLQLMIGWGIDATAQELSVGGYLQTWMILSQSQKIELAEGTEQYDTWGFRIRRARISARARLNDTFSVNSLFEFAGRDRNMLDFNFTGNFSNSFNLTAGQFIPAGQMFDTGRLSSSVLLFYERPTISVELSRAMRYDSFRDIGVMANGKIGPVWYAAHVCNGLGRYSSAGDVIYDRKFGQGLYGARVDIDLLPRVTVGGHYTVNRQDNIIQTGIPPGTIDRTSFSFRAAATDIPVPGLFAQFEYGNYTNAEGSSELTSDGWYVTAGYSVKPELMILGRYDTYMPDLPFTAFPPKENNITVGALYFIREGNREIFRIGLNYGYRDQKLIASEEVNRTNSIVLWVQVRSMP